MRRTTARPPQVTQSGLAAAFTGEPRSQMRSVKTRQVEKPAATNRVVDSLRAQAPSSTDPTAKVKKKKSKKGNKKQGSLQGQLKAAVEGLTRAHQYLAEERSRLLTESRESQASPPPTESGLDSDRRSHDYNWKVDKIEEHVSSNRYDDVVLHLKQELETRGAEFEALRSDLSSRLLSYESLLGRMEAKYDAQIRSVQENSSEALDLANRSVRVLEKFEHDRAALNAHVSEELERLSTRLEGMEASISSHNRDFIEKNRQIEVRLKPKVEAQEELQSQMLARLTGLEGKLDAIMRDHTGFKSELERMNSAYESLRQRVVSRESEGGFDMQGSFSEDSISPRSDVPSKFQGGDPRRWNEEAPSRGTVDTLIVKVKGLDAHVRSLQLELRQENEFWNKRFSADNNMEDVAVKVRTYNLVRELHKKYEETNNQHRSLMRELQRLSERSREAFSFETGCKDSDIDTKLRVDSSLEACAKFLLSGVYLLTSFAQSMKHSLSAMRIGQEAALPASNGCQGSFQLLLGPKVGKFDGRWASGRNMPSDSLES
ncbi:hypothetical protein GUITHDRAFT_141599 [Guillardia theta CCMP2712]|uniref:Uncharacterized protein n=1 Tax=Guillardia theta (strain CCMP2712) TaxID=905079 RepID=L1J139_GUITC|nr:hypothetical protein GUITHDRAFT_141599 [Guillardia theta CCMP2712]EKX41839.1 hypothetical protein GUITHDRAFT_141599 [Guillardia theta CCMP2712]|eukprot:XP_005828819.1 hypothetical protein GUITHDRAFT_141599 [Guillardia theta CCMP2712]